ncbi:MAG: YcxB family protein [Janthinobacterium lividum]
MEVTFALTQQDLWEFNSFVIRRVLAFKIRIALRFAIVPLGIIALTGVAGFQTWQCILFGIATAVVWVPFCLWSARFHVSRAAHKSLGLLGTQTLKVDGAGLRQVTARVDSLIQWKAFPEVEESASQILFFTDKQHAIIVPKRVFGSLAQGQAFLERAQCCWNAAKNGETIPDAIANDISIWPPAPRPGA